MGRQKKKDEKENSRTGKGRISIISSIRTKILILVIAAIVLTSCIFLWTIIPVMKENLSEINENYMKDVVISYGELLDKALSVDETMLDSEHLENMIGDVSINDVPSSYAYVVDADGIMLFHPKQEKIGQMVENEVIVNLVDELKGGKTAEPSVSSYMFRGMKKYAAYYVGTDAKYIFVISADEEEMFSIVNYIVKRTVATGLFSLIVFGILGIVVVEFMVRPINRITGVVTKLADMDFTYDDVQEKLNRRQDETGSMSRAISRLRESLREIVTGIRDQSAEIYQASEDLNGNAKNTANTMGEVEKAVSEIADGATSQAQETQKATENVILMGNMVEETNQAVKLLRDYAGNIKESSNNATKILTDLERINKKSEEAMQVISTQTNTTNESAVKIREATALITAIAEETNLLSLNAAIEAARAGEQGRGFAVVATQIQKLAEQSDESAKQIEGIVGSLIADSEKAVETMNAVREIVDLQSQNVNKTNTIFEEVKCGIDQSIEGIAEIAEKTIKMDEARINVVDIVQNLTAIAQENAASTEETSASVSEVTNIVSSISDNSERLKEVSVKLEKHMEYFRL